MSEYGEWGEISEDIDPNPEWGYIAIQGDTIMEDTWLGIGITPIEMDDQYIILLDDKDNPDPFLGKIVSIVEEDQTVHFESDNDKIFIFAYDTTKEIIKETPNYKVIDLIRIIDYDLVKNEISEEYDFDVEELDEKEKIYSDIVLKDDLLSQLIESFDCYDEPLIIHKLNKDINIILSIISSLKNEIIPKKTTWLIPITDDELKLYGDSELGNFNSINKEIIN